MSRQDAGATSTPPPASAALGAPDRKACVWLIGALARMAREISKMGEVFFGASGYGRSVETYTHALEVLWET